VAKLIKKSNKS